MQRLVGTHRYNGSSGKNYFPSVSRFFRRQTEKLLSVNPQALTESPTLYSDGTGIKI